MQILRKTLMPYFAKVKNSLPTLDIRLIKCSMTMHIIRAKTPKMVRTEFSSCLPAYNVICEKTLQLSATTGRDSGAVTDCGRSAIVDDEWPWLD
jgi:hypothetical protein